VNATIRIVGLDKAIAKVRTAVFAGVDDALAVAGARGQQLVVQTMEQPYAGRADAISSGVLVGGIAFERIRGVDIAGVRIFAGPPGDRYADPVEAGSRPHFPPPGALLSWVKRTFGASSEKQALSIAFAIARKIAKRGVKPFLMFDRVFRVLEHELGGIFERAIGASLQKNGAGK